MAHWIVSVIMRKSQEQSGFSRHLLWIGLGLAAAGCGPQTTARPGYEPALAPTTDRLIAAYPDLASRRFQVLADFESPEQASLFRLESGETSSPLTINTERARLETGVGSLKMSLLNSSQQVAALDSPGLKWGLHRDWTKYHLLLMAVFSPRDLGGFTFSVTSGTDQKLTYRHPRIYLRQGWNTIRVDLAGISEQINVADVRELRFWAEPLDTPIDLYLDDLILANNEVAMFGRSNGERGDLYVKSQGRRIVVGSVERFELVFHRGQIVQWFDLAHDPARLHNLAGRGALGPSPVVVDPAPGAAVRLDDSSQWSGLGLAVESFQRLEEANPVRAVVVGEWRFGAPGGRTSEMNPFHRWAYCVHPDGRIYVECRGTAKSTTFDPPGLGVVFACDGDQGFTRRVFEGAPGGPTAPIGQEPYAQFARSDPGPTGLLVVPFSPLVARTMRAADDPRLCVLWRMPPRGDHFLFTALVRVWPADIGAAEQAGPYAIDYCHPLSIALDAGQLVRTDDGDYDNDGYSEARGYYVLQLDANVAKVRIDGRRYPRFSPVFRIVDVANRDVWVYADGRQIRNLYRHPQGDVLFSVSGPITGETLIEVNAGPKSAP